jgi:hypothetical protein
MPEIEVRLIVDIDDLRRDLESLTDIPELPFEVRDSLIHAFSGSSQPLRVDCENASATGARDLRVSIKLSDITRDFVAALRTRYRNRVVVDESHASQRSATDQSNRSFSCL